MPDRSPVAVGSEVGRLRRVIVHEPGLEVDRMVPSMMEQLLFDDILYGERARDEHAAFRRVLQLCGVEVHEANDLLREALRNEDSREWVIEVLLADLPERHRRPLLDLRPRELVDQLVEGARRPGEDAGDDEFPGDLWSIAPLPNWCFQRDPQIVLGDGVVFCSMAAPARHRESLLARAVFRFHPEFGRVPVLFDPIEGTREHLFVGEERPTLEGGDLLVLSPDVVAVGISERTNRLGVRYLARALQRREGGPRRLLAVQLPRRRAYMHLDTLITPIDRDACLVFPPVILGQGEEAARVNEIDLEDEDLTWRPCGPLLETLRGHGLDYEPIPCGGDDPVAQQREQWTDGANAFALAPGVVTLYDRNMATAEELDRRGFRIVVAEDLLLGRDEVRLDDGTRVCILISSHELSRARGGPHCLTHPLLREPA